MKKLILLAVVVFGFAATTFAQKNLVDNVVSGNIAVPASLNVDVTFSKDVALSFGSVASSPLYDGTLLVKANGQVVKTNVTATGAVPASFKITKLLSGTPIILINKQHWNLDAGVTLDIIQDDPDYVSSTAGATTGDFTVKVGGLLSIPKKASTNFSISDFSVTLNNQ